jgi:hypothetical protein
MKASPLSTAGYISLHSAGKERYECSAGAPSNQGAELIANVKKLKRGPGCCSRSGRVLSPSSLA